jgi:hypothetical protein
MVHFNDWEKGMMCSMIISHGFKVTEERQKEREREKEIEREVREI